MPQDFGGKLELSPTLMCTLTFTRLEIWDLPLGIFTCSNPELSNLVKTNSVSLQTEQDRHRLNVFFTPLFCYFAEDTGLFPDVSFTQAIPSHSREDGAGTNIIIEDVFRFHVSSSSPQWVSLGVRPALHLGTENFENHRAVVPRRSQAAVRSRLRFRPKARKAAASHR